MSDNESLAPDASSEALSGPFSETPESAEPAWIARDAKGRVLPGFPGPRYAGKATSTIARAEKLIRASQPLIEKRDRIVGGGPEANRELLQMLSNSVVALDHFEREVGARLVLEGPLSGKGYARSALTIAANLATQKARLIDKLVPLLGITSSAPRTALDVANLSDDELKTVRDILAAAAERAKAPPPEPEETEPEPFVVEVSEETASE